MRQLLRVAPIAVVLALVVPVLNPHVVNAQTVDQQRDRVTAIVDELERLEQQSLDLAEDYVESLDAKAALDQEIVDAEAEIAAKEAELVKLQGDLGDMAVRAFVGAGATPLGPLFENSGDINDVLQRDELARVALSAGDVTSDELDAFVTDLEEARVELENKREQAIALTESLETAQAETARLRDDYIQARAEAEAKLGQLIAEEEERRARESYERLQRQLAEEAAANAADNSGNSGGGNSGTSGGGSSGNGGSGGGSTGSGGGSGGASGGSGSGGGGASNPPVSSLSSVAVNAAMSQQGVPYKYATSSPGVSFDCSGLTKYAWGKAGIYLPHQSRSQYASIPHVSKNAAQPGDLVFFYSPISHVGVYIGGGQHVHAPATGDVVKVSNVNWGNVTGVGRPG